MEVYGVVYLIIDGTNDKEYVGQTTRTVEVRFKEHANYNNSYIGNAIRAHGEDIFAIAILKECATKEELDFWERHFIYSRNTIYPNGYNLTDGGEGGIPCDEARAKMAEAHKGREVSAETRAKLSAAFSGEKNPRYGKKNTPEHTARIVAANLGAKRSPETCKNISEALKGKPFTLERCANISAAKRDESPFKNLTAEMVARNLSYAALEKLTGIAHLSEKMRGHRKFTARDKIKLEELFGKPAAYLLECDPELLAEMSEAPCAKSPFKNLIAELDKRHMTYRQFAELMDLKMSSIVRKLRGERNFTVKDKAKLEEIFGKPIEYLLAR